MFLECIKKQRGKTEVALHKLFRSLGTVHAGKVEDKVAIRAVLVEVLDC